MQNASETFLNSSVLYTRKPTNFSNFAHDDLFLTMLQIFLIFLFGSNLSCIIANLFIYPRFGLVMLHSKLNLNILLFFCGWTLLRIKEKKIFLIISLLLWGDFSFSRGIELLSLSGKRKKNGIEC